MNEFYKYILAISFATFTGSIAYAQSPQKFGYQAVIRKPSGDLVTNQAVATRISILQGSSSGPVVYEETQNALTNTNGLLTFEIGSGTVAVGDLGSIDWSNGPYFIRTETDPDGGTNYAIQTNMQLLSVPYALYAQTASESLNDADGQLLSISGQDISISNGNTITLPGTANPVGNAGGELSGTYPNPVISNNAVTTAKINSAAVTTDKLANAAVTANKFHQMGALNGQVLKWNGSSWSPAADENTNFWILEGDTLKRGTSATRLDAGFGTTNASGLNSTAMGLNSTASGVAATTMGSHTIASGNYATASGLETVASGNYAFAAGNNTQASADFSTSMGYNTTSSSMYATAIGNGTTASGATSTAIGFQTIASGQNAIAMGNGSTASGFTSLAFGDNSTASGNRAIAIGNTNVASGNYSTALGSRVSTNNFQGSFMIGDYHAGAILNASAGNQMTMRFSGGYRLFTNSGSSMGVSLAGNANSWATISDSTKKENFLMTDGQMLLRKLSAMKLGSWNYKGQDPIHYRHYGPMAQEFYAHFGDDGLGTIGNDTTIASADIDGVMMIAIQALIKENEQLKTENTQLRTDNSVLKSRQDTLELQFSALQQEQHQIAEILKDMGFVPAASETRKPIAGH